MNYPAVEELIFMKGFEESDGNISFQKGDGERLRKALPELRALLANEKKLEAKLSDAKIAFYSISIMNSAGAVVQEFAKERGDEL